MTQLLPLQPLGLPTVIRRVSPRKAEPLGDFDAPQRLCTGREDELFSDEVHVTGGRPTAETDDDVRASELRWAGRRDVCPDRRGA
jgi:hypothetical protein